jgi:hypothetical protein
MSLHGLWGPLQAALARQPLILAWPRLGAAASVVEQLEQLGATVRGVAAVRRGRGALPAQLPTWVAEEQSEAGPAGDDFIREFQRYELLMGSASPGLRAFIDALDPEGEAQVLCPHAADLRAVAGRPLWGGVDPEARRALEDKTTIDALWDQLALPRAPRLVVPLPQAAAAAAQLDQGAGTVWAGDNTTTIEGGALTTRHVHDATSAAAAHAALDGRCAQVRVMPHLAGVPCAIQAMVLTDGVAVMRPMEMIVLREPPTGRFVLCGMATTWDASWELRASMRALARAVGAHLRATYGWVGGFSIDGIATPDGAFLPTELNARFSAGLSLLETVCPGPPLHLVDRALRAGAPLRLRAEELERALLPAIDHRRVVNAHLHHVAPPPSPAPPPLPLLPDADGVWRAAPQARAAPAALRWTDTGTHGVLTLDPDPALLRRGPPLAPRFADALRAARAAWGIDLPALAPAVGLGG